MPYAVMADRIAQDIPEGVRSQILDFLSTYDFPYVTTVSESNKERLKDIFREHFVDRHDLPWLRDQISSIALPRGVAPIAFTETNRMHTRGLGQLLLNRGETACKTIHSYGSGTMQPVCIANLEGRALNISEILRNTFPADIRELSRNDVPMVPQHPNCRHVLSPFRDDMQIE